MENKLKNKIITVTGGFGFIGSFLVDRLLDYNVKKIIIIDNQKYSRDHLKFRLNNKIIVHKVSLNNINIEKLVQLLKGSHFLFHLAA